MRRIIELDLGLTRRAALQTGAGAAAMAALGAWPTRAQGNFDWQRFKGESIEVILSKSPRSDLLQRHQAEFEEMTGITVGAEQIPEQQHRQKQVIEFTSGNPTFDVTSVSWHVQKRLFAKGQWLEDLRTYLEDPEMTSPDYDATDFSNAGMVYATQSDGRIDTLPQVIDYWVIYWNKALFDAKGVPYPGTLDGLLEAAKALNDPDNNIYGFVARGLKNANTPVWTSFLLGWDVDSVDAEGNLNTTGPEAVAAAKLYQSLNQNYAPPGVVGFNWNECQTTFSQGNAAMWFDGIGFAPPLEDPEQSKIAGNVGYGVVPPGPNAQHSGMFGSGMGVSAFSEKKGAAYYYCQWATDKMNQARILEDGAGSPCRNSAYENQQALANLKVPMQWVDALVESGKIGRPGLPVVIPVTEFRDIFGIGLTNMIGGADPAEELEKATEQFRPILEKSEQL
ncbi:MAG: ABC transporter substrate-binding protein [Geminicoccales bacterium]